MFHQGECEPGYPIIFLLEYDRYISCLFVGGLLRKEEGGQVKYNYSSFFLGWGVCQVFNADLMYFFQCLFKFTL